MRRPLPLDPDHRLALRAAELDDREALFEMRPAVLRALTDAGLIARDGPGKWRLTPAGARRLADDFRSSEPAIRVSAPTGIGLVFGRHRRRSRR